LPGELDDTLSIMVYERGRARLSRYRLLLQFEREMPVTPAELAARLERWSPDLLVVPSEEFDRVCTEAIDGDHPLALVPALTPSRRTGDLPAKICLVVPAGANLTDPRLLIARLARALLISPTTELLGSWALRREVERRLKRGEKFTFHYADMDNFKAFNDHYGFERGDRAIRLLADLCAEAVAKAGHANDLAGHIGGDDFCLVTSLETARPVAETLIASFDAKVAGLYDQEDAERGYITVPDRKGKENRYPLMSLTIASVSNATRPISGYPELAAIAAELKAYAKSLDGSVYIQDRRRAEVRETAG